jgi:hypothetical protein
MFPSLLRKLKEKRVLNIKYEDEYIDIHKKGSEKHWTGELELHTKDVLLVALVQD